ncbi:hypothetical protein [Chondromyces crocatus]|uniref:hypothetical protein n=1 Tax=Chondromyces crocatus TaxID=52 RepID=UPI0012E156C4|nr:hypothetical protein [Chondromyces crocatus]
MPIPSNPVPEFCAACGFPLRGPRCEACGVHRVAAGRRAGMAPDVESPSDTDIETWRTRDPVRFVGHCIAAEAGNTIPTTSAQDGIGWIFTLRTMPLFVSCEPGADRASIDVPVTRVPERQRVPLLRAALELSAHHLPARLCVRDDLLVLRRVIYLSTLTVASLRLALRTSAERAEQLSSLLTAWFDARPAFTDDQRTSLSWALIGRSRPLKSFSIPPPVRSLPPLPSQGAPPLAPLPPPPRSARVPPPEPSWGAPKLVETGVRPSSRDTESLPDILSPLFASAPAPSSPRVSSTITPPPFPSPPGARRATPLPVPPSGPAELRAVYGAGLGALPGEAIPGASERAGGARRGGLAEVASPPVSVPFSMRPPAPSESEPDARRERPPAERFCQILRDAQAHATAVSFLEKPGVMLILIRSTVFRAILEHGEALPHAVAHLYRATAAVTRDLAQAETSGRRVSPTSMAEPALHAMERLVSSRGHTPDEKPLQIEPLTSATHAREHLSRYLREIDRAPADLPLRHFLALGALSELLVRAKLPSKTDQRLREIVAYAHRDGPKSASIDLMMTALNRIVSQ